MRIESSSATDRKHNSKDVRTSVSVDEKSMKKLSRILSRNIYTMSASFVREAWLNARESVDKRSHDSGSYSDEWRGQDATKRTEVILPSFNPNSRGESVKYTSKSDLEIVFGERKLCSKIDANSLKTKTIYGSTLDLGSTFSLRDYGVGMSHNDFESLILSFGTSSKDGDDTYGGGMGIGSLSAFSMTDEIDFDCFKDGIKNSYKIMDYGEVVVRYIEDEPTDQEDGVRITCDIDFNEKFNSSGENKDVAINEYFNFITDCLNFFILSKENESISIVVPEFSQSGEGETILIGLDNYYTNTPYPLFSGYRYDYSYKDIQIGKLIEKGGGVYPQENNTNFFFRHNEHSAYLDSKFFSNTINVLIDGCLYTGKCNKNVYEYLESKVSEYLVDKNNISPNIASSIMHNLQLKRANSERAICVPVGYFSVEDDMSPSRETVNLSDMEIDFWANSIIDEISYLLDFCIEYNNIICHRVEFDADEKDLMSKSKKIINTYSAIYDIDCDLDKIIPILQSFGSKNYRRINFSGIDNMLEVADFMSLGIINGKPLNTFIADNSDKINGSVSASLFLEKNKISVDFEFVNTKTGLRAVESARYSTGNSLFYGKKGFDNAYDYSSVIGYDDSGDFQVKAVPANGYTIINISKVGDKEEVSNCIIVSETRSAVGKTRPQLDLLSRNIEDGDISDDKVKKIAKEAKAGNVVADKVLDFINNGDEDDKLSIVSSCGIYGENIVFVDDDSVDVDVNINNVNVEKESDVNRVSLSFFIPKDSVFADVKDFRKVYSHISSKKKSVNVDKGAKYDFFINTIEDGKKKTSVMHKEYLVDAIGSNIDNDSEYKDYKIFVTPKSFFYNNYSDNFSDSDNLEGEKKENFDRYNSVFKSVNEKNIYRNRCGRDFNALLSFFYPKNFIVMSLSSDNMKIERAKVILNKNGYNNVTVIEDEKQALDVINLTDEETDKRIVNFLSEYVKGELSKSLAQRIMNHSSIHFDMRSRGNLVFRYKESVSAKLISHVIQEISGKKFDSTEETIASSIGLARIEGVEKQKIFDDSGYEYLESQKIDTSAFALYVLPFIDRYIASNMDNVIVSESMENIYDKSREMSAIVNALDSASFKIHARYVIEMDALVPYYFSEEEMGGIAKKIISLSES